MDQPSVGLAIQGLLSHILVEDYSDIQKKLADSKSSSTNGNKDAEDLEEKLEDVDKVDGDESEKDSSEIEKKRNVVAFYKLEMIRIQLISAQGDQVCNKASVYFYVHLSLFLRNLLLFNLSIICISGKLVSCLPLFCFVIGKFHGSRF